MANSILCPCHLEGISKCEKFQGSGDMCRNYEHCENYLESTKKFLTVGKPEDGEKTAVIFMSFFMNSFPSNHKGFYDEMLNAKKEVINNFNVLCFSWLTALSDVRCYDDRNEDSVFFARKYKDDLMKAMPEYIRLDEECGNYFVVSYRSDSEMAEYITKYLSCSDNCKDFIKHGLYTHKSLQQNLTRFIYGWFCYYLENGETDNESIKEVLEKICADKAGFRYI